MTSIDPKVDQVLHCPSCLSACVNFSVVVGGDASCGVCKWSGKNNELVGAPFQHDFLSSDAIVNQLISSTKVMVAKDVGHVLLDHLVKWGFITKTNDIKKMTRELGMYLAAFAEVYVKTALDVRKKIALENDKSEINGGGNGPIKS